MLNILNWLKQNLKDVIDFLKGFAIEINISHKEETKRNIKVTNLFVVLVLVIVLVLAAWAFKTGLWAFVKYYLGI
jgi:hypothetical protein